MKSIRRRLAPVMLGAFAVLAMAAGTSRGAEDINTLFQMGRAAYYKGDMEMANLLLSQVAARNPNHFETKALLAQIRSQMKPEGSLRKTYQGVTLAKIDFTDVTLQEALDALKVLARESSGGKVIPNFIIKEPTLGAKAFSLNLNNVPLPDAIQYLAELVGARVTYDKHAVIFTGAAG